MMKEQHIKYGAIAVIAIIILYALFRGGRSTGTVAASDGGAVAVDVAPSTPQGDSGALAARASAFSEVAGLFGQTLAEQSDREQARIANETARQIAAGQEETSRQIAAGQEQTARQAIDVGAQVERIRGEQQQARDEFQASAVRGLAESFRKTDVSRQSAVLNALVSLWNGSTGYVFSPKTGGGATGIINAIGNAAGNVGKLFTFGLG
jgi:hypothetical protein